MKVVSLMRTLFARARAYAPLTPAERALLRLLEGLLCAALVAALPLLADALSRTSVNWGNVARTALAAAAVAILLALAKYARAHGDPALGAVLSAGATILDKRAGLPDAPAPPAGPPADSPAA